jgi:DEAD/DEAH box helicase domain-containing protein
MHLLVVDDRATRCHDALLCAEVISSSGFVQLAAFDSRTVQPGFTWGICMDHSLLVRCRKPGMPSILEGRPVSPALVDSVRPNQCSVFLARTELDGPVKDIGVKFWSCLFKAAPWLEELARTSAPVSIQYSDRYLVSPLSARVLFEICAALQNFAPSGASKPRIVLTAMKSEERVQGGSLHQNWNNERVQESVLKRLLLPLSRTNPTINLLRRESIPHARMMRLEWADRQIAEITLDQGVGFTKTKENVPHDFQAKPELQAEALKTAFSVTQASSPVPFYVMRGR